MKYMLGIYKYICGNNVNWLKPIHIIGLIYNYMIFVYFC